MHTDEAIRTRKTEKILGDPENLPAIDEQQQTQVRNDLEELLQLAGNAPFHKQLSPVLSNPETSENPGAEARRARSVADSHWTPPDPGDYSFDFSWDCESIPGWARPTFPPSAFFRMAT